MVRSMWSGVQGLYIHQQEMDVIGNNISNVNTTSFKAQQTTFSDLLYQTTQRAYGAAGTKSGVNAKQVGLGAMTSSIMTAISKQGSIQTTDAPFDMSISGDSFFQVGTLEDGADDPRNAELSQITYTRDGSFAVDENGYLVTRAEGKYVLGISNEDFNTDADGATHYYTSGQDIGPINILDIVPRDIYDQDGNYLRTEDAVAIMAGTQTTGATITGNISRTDDVLSTSKGRTVELEVYATKTDEKTGVVSVVPYSLVFQLTDGADDDPETYRMEIVKILDENGKTISEKTVDENGEIQPVDLDVTTFDLRFRTGDVRTEDGKTVLVRAGTLQSITANGKTIDITGDVNSNVVKTTGTGKMKDSISGLDLDFSTLTNYAPANSTVVTSSEVKSYKGIEDTYANPEFPNDPSKRVNRGGMREGSEGYPDGEMNGVSIGNDGTITKLYSNGQTEFAGQIVVAQFANASGLTKVGENQYAVSPNSGEPNMLYVNEDGGRINPGTLEMSNVDLANEFTNMITAQRGFQANSKVITTSDEMIQIVRDLKR